MKRTIIIFTLLLLITVSAFGSNNLRNHFRNPSMDYAPWVFWMWMNGNVTKEGITLDLEAMSRVGISGAVLFSSNAGIPEGGVEYASPEWMELNRYMFAEAQRLNMKIMLHNGPGYSVTGGPWITPENSMQQVVWTETFINDEQDNVKIARPYSKLGYYEDICVIAYPSIKGERTSMQLLLDQVLVNGELEDKKILTNSDYESSIEVLTQKNTGFGELVLQFKEPFEASSIVIRRKPTEPPHHPYDGPRDNPPTYTLEYSDDGKSFKSVCNISMPALRELNAPSSKSFKSVKAKYFRVLTNKNTEITELNLYSASRLDSWENKANFLTKGNRNTDLSEKQFSNEEIIDPDRVIDITKFLSSDDQLNWKVPEGNWTILRIGHTTTGQENIAAPFNANGLECDKLGKRGINAHYNGFLKHLFSEMEEFLGKSFYGITADSWEAGTQNWTKDFEKEYFMRIQKSIVPYMPCFTGRVVSSTYNTEKFLETIRELQATMLAENYHKELRDICHQNNLSFLNESYGDGPFNSLEVSKYVDIPAGEFWAHGLYGGSHTNNQAGYIVRINNQKVAAAEAYTAMPDLSKFTEFPAAMKAEGDWMFTNGINRFMYHTFAHQPHPSAKPGMTMGPFGTHMNRNQTWWEQSKNYMDYIRRCQFMLQQGYFISNSSPWVPPGHSTDPTKKEGDFSYFSLNKNSIINYIHRKVDNTDFYYITNNKRNPERIIAVFDILDKQPELWYPESGKQLIVNDYKIENGKTVIPLNLNSSESVFVVFSDKLQREPKWKDEYDLRKKKIDNRFFASVYDSFTISVWVRPEVIAVNGRSYVLYPKSGENSYGKGHATIGLSVGQNVIRLFEQSERESIQVLNVDTKIEGWSLVNVVYDHGKPIIYLNGVKVGEGVKSKFIVHANDNELADKDELITVFQGEYDTPVIENKIISLNNVKRLYAKGRDTEKPFFIDNEELSIAHVIEFDKPWNVGFTGTSKTIKESELKSLHLYKDKDIKYFSGTSAYLNTLNMSGENEESNKRFILDLGNVAYFAEIYINDEEHSVLWKPPYVADITNLLNKGENKIEIRVTNLWTNRLIGDEFLPSENNYDQWGEIDKLPGWYVNNEQHTGKRNTFVTWRQYDKDGPLTEGGLIGPVRVLILN